MEGTIFTNDNILAWLSYFSSGTELDLTKVKLLDITRKNRNLLPTVQQNRAAAVFTDAGHPDIFYDLWEAGLGGCDVWYNEGAEPTGPLKHDKLRDMIDRGINASAAMLIINPDAKSAYQIGMDNADFSAGSIHYVGSEIRAVIMSKLHVGLQDTVLIVGGASIAVEAAMIAGEGTVIDVEYDAQDRKTMEENAEKFGLNNVVTAADVTDETLADLPVPSLAFLVASPRLDEELSYLCRRNPKMRFVVYTLDFHLLISLPALLEAHGISLLETIQIAISRLNHKGLFEAQSAPWLLSGQAI